jgi:predicted LPLAT superfamily acyltransferase
MMETTETLVDDSILDPDVVIRNAELYRLFRHQDSDWLDSVLRAAVNAEKATVLRHRYDRYRRAAADQFRRVPQLCDAADTLSARWADYRFTRDTEATLLISRLGAATDVERELEVIGLDKAASLAGGHRSPLFVSVHYGAYQALPAALAAVGLRPACIMDGGARPVAEQLMGALAPRLLERITFISAQSPNVRAELMGPLMAGDPVLMHTEFAFKKSRSTTEFLGRTVHTPRGTELLASVAGVPVVPVRLEANAEVRRLVFEDPLWCPGEATGNGEVTAKVFAWTESLVAADPTQWWCWEVFEMLMAADHVDVGAEIGAAG